MRGVCLHIVYKTAAFAQFHIQQGVHAGAADKIREKKICETGVGEYACHGNAECGVRLVQPVEADGIIGRNKNIVPATLTARSGCQRSEVFLYKRRYASLALRSAVERQNVSGSIESVQKTAAVDSGVPKMLCPTGEPANTWSSKSSKTASLGVSR